MGCTLVVNRHGYLALRLYWRGRESWEGTGLKDTPENRARVSRLAALVDAEVRAREFTPERYLHFFPRGNRSEQIRGELGIRSEYETAAAGPTLRAYSAQWLEHQRPPARIATYYAKAASHLKRLGGVVLPDGKLLLDLPLAALTRSTMGDVRACLLGKDSLRPAKGEDGRPARPRKLGIKSVRNIMTGTLAAILTAAHDEGLIERHPLRGLAWKKPKPKQINPLSDAERDAVLAWFRARHPIYVPFLSTLLFTGMRIGEASALRWGDVDLERGRIEINKSRTMGEDNAAKTQASHRTIQLIPELVRILREGAPLVRAPGDFVFRGRDGGPINAQNLYQRRWLSCLAKLKLGPRTLYQCRHTFICIGLSNGMNLKWAAQYTGTSVTMIERHYARWIVPTADQMALIRGENRDLSGGSRVRPEKALKTKGRRRVSEGS